MIWIRFLAVSAIVGIASTFHTLQKPLGPASQDYPIPGGSPWRNCVDPSEHLFKIDSAAMSPNPCMVESLCKVNITGSLTKPVTNATLSWNVTTHFNDGRVGQIPGVDNLYRWVNVFQNGTRTWDLKPGPALMNQSFLLLGGWVPVANYSAVFNVTSHEGTWFRLCADWEMRLNE
ncbi:MAG: hypothetical protein Q9206_004651 [Seirophora lacunosa]